MNLFGTRSNQTAKLNEPDFIHLDMREDATPRVSFDISLGKKVLFIDADIEGIAERMRSEGIPEDRIGSTEIHFADKAVIKPGEKQGYDTVVRGEYNQKSKGIELYLEPDLGNAALVEDINERLARLLGVEPLVMRGLNYSDLSSTVNQTLYHELRHLSQDVNHPNMDRRYFINNMVKAQSVSLAAYGGMFLPSHAVLEAGNINNPVVTIVAIAISALAGSIVSKSYYDRSSHARYLGKPSEVDARAAEEESGTKRLVEIRVDRSSLQNSIAPTTPQQS